MVYLEEYIAPVDTFTVEVLQSRQKGWPSEELLSRKQPRVTQRLKRELRATVHTEAQGELRFCEVDVATACDLCCRACREQCI